MANKFAATFHPHAGPTARGGFALRRFLRNLADANSHPFAAFLSFSEEAEEIGLGPDWRGLVEDVEAEGSRRIGAKPCPGPHGVENEVGEIDPLEVPYVMPLRTLIPCPSCGAVR